MQFSIFNNFYLFHRSSFCPYLIVVPAFLLLGFYGGFIQMGMGVIFLAVMVLGAKWSLIDSNVIKSLIQYCKLLLSRGIRLAEA